ncbi:outer dynein arm-docking complex subunit 1 isoform X2 [Notamacropus eugenii]|uniref:outer dynein arm-docking complex subunit 1 isoform X2 n=2 Tax=Notamacropus eugenii TaxID=9315 RepID=UPI003B671176
MPLAISVRSEDSEAYLDSSGKCSGRGVGAGRWPGLPPADPAPACPPPCRGGAEPPAETMPGDGGGAAGLRPGDPAADPQADGGDPKAAAGADGAPGEDGDLAEPSPEAPGPGAGEGPSKPPGAQAAAVQGGDPGAGAPEEAGPTGGAGAGGSAGLGLPANGGPTESLLHGPTGPQIAKWESRVLLQLKDLRGPGLVLQRKARDLRRVKILENQLDRATTRFDTQLVRNRILREELGLLHIQRNRFLYINQQLKKELQDIRSTIRSHIDESNSAFDAREEAKLKLSQLQEKLDKDISQYNAELQVVQRQICHLEQLHNFLVTKNQERLVDAEVMEARRKREHEVAAGLRKTSHEKAILQYEEVLEKLGQITGQSNAEDILQIYLENEERNFAEFTFINEQNSEMEKLKEEIQEIQDALAQLTLAQEEADKGAKRQQLDALEQRKVDLAKEAEVVEVKHSNLTKILEQLKSAIQSLFYKAKCDDTKLKELLGGSHMGNKIVELLLSLTEQRVIDLLATQAFTNSESSTYNPKSTALRLLGQSEDAIPKKLVPPQAPSNMDDPMGLEQMDERPLTREEILAMVLKAMQEREQVKEQSPMSMPPSKRASEKPL